MLVLLVLRAALMNTCFVVSSFYVAVVVVGRWCRMLVYDVRPSCLTNGGLVGDRLLDVQFSNVQPSINR